VIPVVHLANLALEEEQRQMIGKVKWFNNRKGYGFLGRDTGPDLFVHYSAILGDGYRTLAEGDSVEFEIVQGPKGASSGKRTKSRRSSCRLEAAFRQYKELKP
jgi:cold shock protein